MPERPDPAATVTRPSTFAPLSEPVFRALWTAGVVSNVGTWMQNVGGAWAMTLLTPSPLLVALMQTATSLPVFLAALPAGALADIVDRRRLLLVAQTAMAAIAAALTVVTFLGWLTPGLLLGFTFALGLVAATSMPAWQAITPEIVSRPNLTAAITLSGVSVNIARAVGPAAGGLVVAAVGAAWVFLLNAVSFLAVIVAVARWKREAADGELPAERLPGAIVAGWRYIRFSQPIHAVLVHAAAFIVSASALWALLPIVAKQGMGLGAAGFGVLQGGLGVGALLGAVSLGRLRAAFGSNQIVAASNAAFAAATLALGLAGSLAAAAPMMVAGGVAWIGMMSSLNVAVLTSSPRWVQARAVAVYMIVFQGGMALGAAFWGSFAERAGTRAGLAAAAATLLLSRLVTRRWPLPEGEAEDLSPSLHWPEPRTVVAPPPDDGPVLVTVEYRIAQERSAEFLAAMRDVERLRRRDGAVRWELFRDPAEPDRWLEAFVTDSWAEHMRQHRRVTVADRARLDRALRHHAGETPPVVSHYVAARRRTR